MTDKFLIKIEKLINSELSSKILSSKIEFNELIFKISHSEILDIIQFLKYDERLKFKQLIDIAAIDYPNKEKRFEIVYLLLSIENNARVKLSINFDTNENITSITQIFPSANWMEEKFLICME